MNYNNERFIASQKNGVEMFASLSEKAFSSFEKLVELNMAATRAILSESIANLHALAGAKDAEAVLALQSGILQPMSDKAASYNRHLYEIASGASAQSQKSMTAFLENSLKNAPTGTEAAMAAIQSAMNASTSAVESAQQAAKQAVKLVESNLSAAASATSHKAD